MASRRARSLSGSLALHGVVVVMALLFARRGPTPTLARGTESVEVDIPPPPPPPVAPPAPAPSPAPDRAIAPTVHRTVGPSPRSVSPDRTLTAVEPGPAEVLPTPVIPTTPTPVVPPAQPLTAANLMRSADDLAVSTAALLPPGHLDRPSRDIYSGSPRPSLQEIAAGPALAMLAATQHMLPPGAGVHDRTLASRAAEAFLPTRTVAGIGDAVRHAPTVSLAPISHDDERDRAAGDSLDAAHASSFSSVMFGGGNTRSYHLVRADVEIDQTPTGAITGARVVRPSGVAAFDAAAMRAIREAVDEVDPLSSSAGGRRTRWAFEVSDSDGPGSRLLGNADEGWTPLSDVVQGMRLRMRVRRLASQRL